MSEHREWRIGAWHVHPSLNRVSRGAETVSLPTRFMDLLVFLAEHQGEVMSKEAITEAVWRREYVSDGTLSHAVAQIRQVLGDDSHNPEYVETIPTRGYRLIAHAEPLGAGESGAPARSNARSLRYRRVVALGAIGVAAVVAVVLGFVVRAGHPARGSAAPGPLHGGRLAVLPFDNLGPADRSYLASGVTDDLTSRLASVPGLPVISRMSSHSVEQAGKSAREIGNELGVDYLLAGTVRWELGETGEGVVRVNAQLIRSADDTHLWGGSYGSPVAPAHRGRSGHRR